MSWMICFCISSRDSSLSIGRFSGLYAVLGADNKYSADIEAIRRVYPATEFVWLEKTLRLGWKDAIALLRENKVEVDDFEDFK